MTIYIVTEGYYSDYTIRRCFTNKDAAKEYKLWNNIDNEIEEYELYDTAFTSADFEVTRKYIWVDLEATVYNSGDIDFKSPKIERRLFCSPINSDIINVVKNDDVKYRLRVCRSIPEEHWNDNISINRIERTAYDLIGEVNYLIADGHDIEDVREFLIDHREDLSE